MTDQQAEVLRAINARAERLIITRFKSMAICDELDKLVSPDPELVIIDRDSSYRETLYLTPDQARKVFAYIAELTLEEYDSIDLIEELKK